MLLDEKLLHIISLISLSSSSMYSQKTHACNPGYYYLNMATEGHIINQLPHLSGVQTSTTAYNKKCRVPVISLQLQLWSSIDSILFSAPGGELTMPMLAQLWHFQSRLPDHFNRCHCNTTKQDSALLSLLSIHCSLLLLYCCTTHTSLAVNLSPIAFGLCSAIRCVFYCG